MKKSSKKNAININNANHYSPQVMAQNLVKACMENKPKIVMKWLNMGAAVDNEIIDNQVFYESAYKTPLLMSIRYDAFEITKMLIEKGANVGAYDNLALRYCSLIGDLDCVKLLVGNGASLSPISNELLKEWVKKSDSREALMQSVVNVGAQESREYELDNALLHASVRGHVKIVQLFIEQIGANPNAAHLFGKENVREYIDVFRERQALSQTIKPFGETLISQKNGHEFKI